MRYNINDIVTIVKEDRYKGQEGQIVEIFSLVHAPVTIYIIKFKNNRKGYYFFSEII